MRLFRLLGFIGLTVCLLGETSALAEPPYLQFLEGLRSRRYEDLALYYLDQLADDPNVPDDVKQVIDYERAVTLIRLGRSLSDPAAQIARLDEASAALERFVKEHPQHPLAAKANSERGTILLGKAEVGLMQADNPGNAGKIEEYRTEARKLITQARDIFEQALKQYDQQYKSYGPYVDAEDQGRRAERRDVENSLIQTRLLLAQTTYREAQTYADQSPKNLQLLSQAADEFEKIHADYRSLIAGLYARLWQGKCFEEQAPRPEEGKELTGKAAQDAKQQLGIAEAIYSELLEHNTQGRPSAADMQALAFRFKLIVRNHPLNADYRLVIDLATEWLKTRTGSNAATPAALGVRYERALAAQQLAMRRDLPEAEATQLLRLALADAEFIVAYPGEFRDVARAIVQKVKVALGRDQETPQDFDSAYGLAQSLLNSQAEKRTAVEAAKNAAQKKTAEQELAEHLDKTAEMLQLALRLAGPEVNSKQLAIARARLGLIEYMRGNFYEAAVLGDYIARTAQDVDSTTALNAAYTAMAAYTGLYNRVPAGESKEFEMQHLVDVSTQLAENFSESEQANEARMNLGGLFRQNDKFVQAADWYGKVPASAGRYPEAQLAAGQAYWEGYAAAVNVPEDERPPQAELEKLISQARTHLDRGLEVMEQRVTADKSPSDDYFAAKVTVAQIANLQGRYQDAIDLLASGTHPVVNQIDVPQGQKRPDKGVKTAAFASITLQSLLRAYIGTQQIDPAVAQMKRLQAVGGADNVQVFVQLGRQIKEEVERLPAGQQRQTVMNTFDAFLKKLAELEAGQTYGSLLWIAETYFGLAQAAAGPKQSEYYNAAAGAYTKILSQAGKADFLPSKEAATGVQLRLAVVEQTRGNFEKAYDLVREVLAASPMALNAQVTAAEILTAWGESEGSDTTQRLTQAIQGDTSDPAVQVWGWGNVARRLQRSIDSQQAGAESLETYRNARYQVPRVRRLLARSLPTADGQKAEAAKAEKELLAYVATTPRSDFSDEWWTKLNDLYGDLQRDQGLAVIQELEPPQEYAATAPPIEQSLAPAPAVAPAAAANPPAESSSGVLPLLVGVVLALGLTGGVVFVLMKGNKPRPATLRNAGDPSVDFGKIAAAQAARGVRPAKRSVSRSVDPAAKGARPIGGKPPTSTAGDASPGKMGGGARPRSRPAEGGEAPRRPTRPPKPEE